jgi:aspartyl-tRNA(Asn)/glutamyl-tRNA(Gln) amidotransferase subunit A
MVAFASSLDQAGPMARTAEDCALLLSAICGPDPDRDSTSLDVPAEDFSRSLGGSIEGLRIGVPKEFFGEGLAADVRGAIDGALKEYEKLGAKLGGDLAAPHRAVDPGVLHHRAGRGLVQPLAFRRREVRPPGQAARRPAGHVQEDPRRGLGDEVKRRIMIGTYVLSHGYYDAYYLQAQRIRRMIADDFQQAFKQCDVIAGPVAPTVAWKLGEHGNDPVADYLADIFTLPVRWPACPA